MRPFHFLLAVLAPAGLFAPLALCAQDAFVTFLKQHELAASTNSEIKDLLHAQLSQQDHHELFTCFASAARQLTPDLDPCFVERLIYNMHSAKDQLTPHTRSLAVDIIAEVIVPNLTPELIQQISAVLGDVHTLLGSACQSLSTPSPLFRLMPLLKQLRGVDWIGVLESDAAKKLADTASTVNWTELVESDSTKTLEEVTRTADFNGFADDLLLPLLNLRGRWAFFGLLNRAGVNLSTDPWIMCLRLIDIALVCGASCHVFVARFC